MEKFKNTAKQMEIPHEGFSETEQMEMNAALHRQAQNMKTLEEIVPEAIEGVSQIEKIESLQNDIREKQKVLDISGGTAGSTRLHKMENEMKKEQHLLNKIFSFMQQRNNKDQN